MPRELDFSVVKALRKQRGITLHELSTKTGISPTTLSGLENSTGNPNLATLTKVADALQIKLSALISMTEQDKPVKRRLEAMSLGGFRFRRAEVAGVRLFWAEANRGASITLPPEIHECSHEACVVVTGSVRFEINGRPFTVKPGEVLEFNHNFEHSCQALEDSEVVVVHVRT